MNPSDIDANTQGGLTAPSAAHPASNAALLQRSQDEAERYTQARQMMSDVIDAHLGFRGHGLTMRLQKTESVRDLHGLLPDFARALVRRVGIEPATSVLSSIERLITGT